MVESNSPDFIETQDGLKFTSKLKPGQLGQAGMLVLTRKQSESIIINDDIRVIITSIRGDRVRIGIQAPGSVPVHRLEVFLRIHGNWPATGPSRELASEPTITEIADEDKEEKLDPKQTDAPQYGGMLVLTRKKNESIIINDVIKLTVVEIRGDKVRLGIEAPREIDVHRQEVWEQIHGKKPEDGPNHAA